VARPANFGNRHRELSAARAGRLEKTQQTVQNCTVFIPTKSYCLNRAIPRAAAAQPDQPAFPLRAAHPFSLPPQLL